MPELPPPIVVLLTPPGRGAIATLRIEGPRAVELVESLWQARAGRPLRAFGCERQALGVFGDNGEEVLVRVCSEDAVEIHCHGGLAAVALIEQSLVAAGCRAVAWQEWIAATEADSFVAEVRMALASARTERTAVILLDQLQGALQKAMDEIRRTIERGDKSAAQQQIESLLARAPLGKHLVRPWSVVLAGRPNVGKSSLMNALAGHRRAVVHDTPGTTRDAVTQMTAIDGWPVELCDTAGLRAANDELEVEGIQRARQRLSAADLVLLVSDLSSPWSEEDQRLVDEWPAALIVHNKCDLPLAGEKRPAGPCVSAQEGTGIDGLLKEISRWLVPDPPASGAAVPFTVNQILMIERLADELLMPT